MCSIIGYCGKPADMTAFQAGFAKTVSRGPDDSRVIDVGQGILGFHRLSIMGLHPEGMQPFGLNGSWVVCNGEIYGFEKLKQALSRDYTFTSESDCEVLLPMYEKYGVGMFEKLDAEFACVLYDGRQKKFIAARDPIGIRPLYYGYDRNGTILFASEPKNLVGLVGKILPFPPGHYYCDGKFVCYCDIAAVDHVLPDDLETVCANIHDKLVAGVKKRLVADAKVGFLLSGGLDSSLVCAIAARESEKPIRTFAIGMSEDAIDLKYAKQVADYIHSDHTEVIISKEDVLAALEPVIELLGTFDITTIRASIGMYAAHRRNLRRAVRLQVYRLCSLCQGVPGGSPEAYPGAAHVRCASGRPVHQRQFSGSAGALRRPGLCQVRHGHRPGDEAEQVRKGQISAASRL